MTYAISFALFYFKKSQNATSEEKRIEFENKGMAKLIKLRGRFSKDILIFESVLAERQEIKGVKIQ